MEEISKRKFSFGAVLFILVVAVLGCAIIGLNFVNSNSNNDNEKLQQQIQKLEVENEVLKHNYDMLSGIDNNEPSQEVELLNTIGQAIQNSKSVDLNIETENGTVRFKYEAK